MRALGLNGPSRALQQRSQTRPTTREPHMSDATTNPDPVSGQDSRDPIDRALEESRRDVLDLSLRNPLLSFRPSKRRGLEVVDELSQELFKILVSGYRTMHFLPVAEGGAEPEFGDGVPADLLALLAEPTSGPSATAAPHTDRRPELTSSYVHTVTAHSQRLPCVSAPVACHCNPGKSADGGQLAGG